MTPMNTSSRSAPATGTRAQSHRKSAAAVARANGWDVGTRLTGDEGHGPTTIEITAVGETMLLAKSISGAGATGRETSWTLGNRDWTEDTPVNPPKAGNA